MALEMDKVLGDILKERFPDYPMELLSHTDKGTGWEVRVRLANVHQANTTPAHDQVRIANPTHSSHSPK